MKAVRVILSPEAEQAYDWLCKNKSEKPILNSINKKVELIKKNIHYGYPIAKRLIPKEYKDKYDIKNLFRVELSRYWRMLYTLTNNDEVEIIAFILDIMSHKDYNKKFGYK